MLLAHAGDAPFDLADLRVVGRCDCGCPTVHFTTAPNGPVVAAAEVAGTNDSILLFRSGDTEELGSLELVWVGDDPPPEFPPPAALRVAAIE